MICMNRVSEILVLCLPIQGVQGSGPGGRIVSRDVLGMQSQPVAVIAPAMENGYTDIELSSMRKVRIPLIACDSW